MEGDKKTVGVKCADEINERVAGRKGGEKENVKMKWSKWRREEGENRK